MAAVGLELEYVTVHLGGCGNCSARPPALIVGSSDDPDFPPTRFDLELPPGSTIFFVRSRSGGTPRLQITDASQASTNPCDVRRPNIVSGLDRSRGSA